MSEPTYRIDVEHRPGEKLLPWYASATRLSDDMVVKGIVHYTSEQAVKELTDWIAAEHTREEGMTLWTDDDGNLVDVPGYSVRV